MLHPHLPVGVGRDERAERIQRTQHGRERGVHDAQTAFFLLVRILGILHHESIGPLERAQTALRVATEANEQLLIPRLEKNLASRLLLEVEAPVACPFLQAFEARDVHFLEIGGAGIIIVHELYCLV